MTASVEQKKALFFSLGLHIVIVLLLFISVNPKPITIPKGSAIMAEIMELPAKNATPANKPPEKKTPAKVEPKPEPKPKPEPEPEPEPEIIKPEPEPEIIKPEPKPDPPKPDPEVIKRQQEQAERLEKIKQLREQRKAAEQAAAEQKVDTETPVENETKVEPEEITGGPLGNPNGDANQERTLLTQYIAAIKSTVSREWKRPVGTEAGLLCQVHVKQALGGMVIDVTIGSPCNANTVVRNSIINAVKKVDPLPYKGFESVYDRNINFMFEYNGD